MMHEITEAVRGKDPHKALEVTEFYALEVTREELIESLLDLENATGPDYKHLLHATKISIGSVDQNRSVGVLVYAVIEREHGPAF